MPEEWLKNLSIVCPQVESPDPFDKSIHHISQFFAVTACIRGTWIEQRYLETGHWQHSYDTDWGTSVARFLVNIVIGLPIYLGAKMLIPQQPMYF